ncbi:MAG: hypothetical protein CTY16_07330 [Methylobacter sp.]|nr:MAG: hypothetical protein CTY16_07330 [Methylobacter sp.]
MAQLALPQLLPLMLQEAVHPMQPAFKLVKILLFQERKKVAVFPKTSPVQPEHLAVLSISRCKTFLQEAMATQGLLAYCWTTYF